MPGRFISLEGGEGAGKSTQLMQLASSLRGRGIDVVETREPGGSAGAEAIRALLLQGEEDRWTPGAEALLFAAARADHVAKLIKPALAEGKWVISDRFLDSSIAYQGGAGGLGTEVIRQLHRIGSGGFLPDRTLLLELPAQAAAERASSATEEPAIVSGRAIADITRRWRRPSARSPRRSRTVFEPSMLRELPKP